MARVAREKSKTGIYHIMLRGINRQTIFEDNQDRVRFLDTLGEYKNICEFVFYGYCQRETGTGTVSHHFLTFPQGAIDSIFHRPGENR